MRWFAGIVATWAATAAVGADFRVVGSDLLAATLTPLVASYRRDNDVAIALELRGSRPGLVELQAGRADLALLFFAPGEALPPGDFICRPVAYQAAVVIAPAAVPLTEITIGQLRGIYGASAPAPVTRWDELGAGSEWSGRAIVPCALAPSASLAFPLFRAKVLQGIAARSTVKWVGKPEDLLRVLGETPNAVGLAAWAPGHPAVRVLAVAAGPNQPACAPTAESLHRGDYPLALPLFVVVRRDARPQLVLFLQHLVSDTGAAAFAGAHLVPLPAAARQQLAFDLEPIVARRPP